MILGKGEPEYWLIRCTTCKIRATTTGLIPFDVSCLFKYTNGQVSTIRNEQSSEICLRIDLEETTECALTLKTTLRGYTLTKWTGANWISFDDNWTRCNDLAEFDHLQVHMERVSCWCEKARVCRFRSLEYRKCSRSISFTFHRIHTEYIGGLYCLFQDRPCQWVPPDLNP